MHDGKEEKNDHTGTRLFCKPSTQQLASDSISCRPDTPETPLHGASGPLTIKRCSRFTALGAATRPDSPLRGRGRAVNSNRQLGWLRETREENTRTTQVYTCTEGQNQQKGNKMAPKMKIKNEPNQTEPSQSPIPPPPRNQVTENSFISSKTRKTPATPYRTSLKPPTQNRIQTPLSLSHLQPQSKPHLKAHPIHRTPDGPLSRSSGSHKECAKARTKSNCSSETPLEAYPSRQ